MLFNEIKEIAKLNSVYVFFDMDGVLAEFETREYDKIKRGDADYFTKSRPIKNTIKFAKKLSKVKNITVGIMSNCYSKVQREDKKTWLKKYMPFIKEENINIISYNEVEFIKEEKDLLKGNYLTNKYKKLKAKIFLIEDNINIIKATNKNFKNISCHHVSMIIN